jgi:LacI family transcriptional regulator
MVDGIIFISDSISKTLQSTFDELNIPVVLILSQSVTCKLPNITIDYENAAFIAVNYLCGLGHKKIAMITMNFKDKNSGIQRINGYKRALRENGVIIEDNMIYEGGDKFNDGYGCMLRILQRKELPTAVFAVSDVLAFGASRAILEHGKRIPEDISIIGFDGFNSAEYFYPPITTIEQPRREMGIEIANLLKSIIIKENPEITNKVLNCKLMIRKSCRQI